MVFYKERIWTSHSPKSALGNPWSNAKRKLNMRKMVYKNKAHNLFVGLRDNSSKGELIELINVAPKGPVYYYCKDQILGEGGYGKVLKGFAMTGKKKKPVAIKTGQLRDVAEFYEDKELGEVPSEVFILKNLPRHPAAIKFLHYEKLSSTTYAIIMERPENSKDLNNLRGYKSFPFSEIKAKKIIRDLASLLKKMEEKKLVHRDIKPQNVVYDLDKDVVKLVDFGLACYFKDGKPFRKFSGTESYMPPEFLVSGSYEAGKDTVWTLGILTYYLFTGCRPYRDATQAISEPYRPPTHLKNFSPDSKDLVESMLSVDPNKRLSLKQVIKHPWLRGQRMPSIPQLIPFTFLKKLKVQLEVHPV